jgi:formylglycine-generating enzyme
MRLLVPVLVALLAAGSATGRGGGAATSLAPVATASAAEADDARGRTVRVAIPAGVVEPFLRVDGEGPTEVAAFWIDATPVTNAQFLAFVTADPGFRRDRVPGLFAAPGYLRHWAGPDDLGRAEPDALVVHVSWFAASAYCEARGARLPTEAEWELVGRASDRELDGRGDPGFAARVLALTTASDPPGPVGRGTPNAYGVHDLHRTFEWVDDAHASLGALDGRNDDDDRLAAVCGGAADGASDRRDYAAFLRVTVRTAIDAAGSSGHLGFRCAGP